MFSSYVQCNISIFGRNLSCICFAFLVENGYFSSLRSCIIVDAGY